MIRRLPLPPQWGRLYAAAISEDKKQGQHEAAHRLLQECLLQYGAEEGVDISLPPALDFGEMGKPVLRDHPQLHFNLSHCSGLAVCLLSDTECGVDCESIRRCKSRIVERVCNAQEIAALESASDADFLFTRLWTLKEAYVKAIGVGISYPLREVGFAFEGERILTNRSDASFMQFLRHGHIVSVCTLQKLEPQSVITIEDRD